MRHLLRSLCLLFALPVCAQAASDVIATYLYSDGTTITLSTRDSRHVRMDTSPKNYSLLANGKMYSVSCEDGQCQSMDMGTMAQMTGGLGSLFNGGADPVNYTIRYEKTGKTETVAGYKGTIYNVVVSENGKVTSRDEMVLCNHADLKKLTEGWIAMAEVLSQTMGQRFQESMSEAKKLGYGGILRYGDQMRLKTLTLKNLNAAYYELPENTQQVDYQQPDQRDDMGLGNDAKEIGYDAKQSTKEEIKDSIRGAISDLFN